MTIHQDADLPNHFPVEVKAIWVKHRGEPGSLANAGGWEVQEWWVIGYPHLSLSEREHVRKQLTPPTP